MIDSSIEYEVIRFPAGEPHVRIVDARKGEPLHVIYDHRFGDNMLEELFILAMLADAARSTGHEVQRLDIGYFPGGRQDRRAVNGDALGAKIFADFINSMGFKEVFIADPHSDVTPALINNCVVIPQSDVLSRALTYASLLGPYALIAPDAGAAKKVWAVAESRPTYHKPQFVLECSKRRDPWTGEITGVSVPTLPMDVRSLVVLDDICDGGRTFIEIGRILSDQDTETILAVSHGLFTKGLDELSKYYDRIFANGKWIK